MKPKFFARQSDFREWLEMNHDKAQELWVGYYKKASGIPSITWPESVDEALCFGWIDGIRKSIDDKSYMIRFTPRNPKSNWSAVNIKRVEELTALGLMKPSGIEASQKRLENKSAQYSYERKHVKLADEYELKFKANKKAWEFFQSLPPSVKKLSTRWVMSAKREETRLKRLESLINASKEEQRIAPLRRNKK
jgi:uncharacterized protein YdeI (YjbR/CyaY-like superfamily)